MEASKQRVRLIALGIIKPQAEEGAPRSEEDTFSKGVIDLVAAANRQIERRSRQRNWAKLKAGSDQYEHGVKRGCR